MAFKIEAKEMYPIFRKVLLVSSACTQQTKRSHSHTTYAVSHKAYVHALLVQHL